MSVRIVAKTHTDQITQVTNHISIPAECELYTYVRQGTEKATSVVPKRDTNYIL